MSKGLKCPDCGEKIDYRKGAVMRGPLEAVLVCLPCRELLRAPQTEMFRPTEPNSLEQQKEKKQ